MRKKNLPEKIRKALEKGELISHEEVMADFSPTEREEIHRRERYIMSAMELRRMKKKIN